MATPKPDEMAYYEHDDMWRVDTTPPSTGWMDTPTVIRPGAYIYPGKKRHLDYLDLPNPRKWVVTEDDWQLPDNWQEIVIKALKVRLDRSRALQIFMDSCVRCGACADKCHFFIGGGDPKNMPVLRAELLRSIYRSEFTLAGKLLGRIMGRALGTRELTIDVIKEWFFYFFQCTECRRCSVYCPFGIDTAEITMIGRELLLELGITVNWIIEPVANCFRTGNHLGILPHGLKDTLEFFAEDIEEITGIHIDPPINKKGADVLFVTPSGDFLANPGTFTCMGYMMLFHELGLNYTWSTYVAEGGNFGLFTSKEVIKRLNSKIYAEARRLGVKSILGGECGHMWRVIHQYMDTMNGPADFLEVPRSPFTNTVFHNAASTKMVHLSEFTADLIKHGKLKLDPDRNDHLRVTFHDSCNPARAMGLLDEPRYVINSVCNHFYDMPENTIREHTFCCGGGAGLGTDENMEMRLRGGLPRGAAVRHVQEKYGVNALAAICAIDRATLMTVCDYWAEGVDVTGITEMVANALVMEGECERELNLRLESLEELRDNAKQEG